MNNFDAFVRVVSNMMSRYGGTAVISTFVEGGYNPATSSSYDDKRVDTTVQTIVFDYVPKTSGSGTTDGTLIKSGDKQIFVKSSDTMVLPSAKTDFITYKGVKYQIITVKEMNTSGNNSLFLEIFGRQ